MTEKSAQDDADDLFAEGKKFDWKQDHSPAAASLARASFKHAAALGHKGAVRAYAHLVYEGRGGAQNKEHALLLLWTAFNRGDQDALEELGDLLASYAEQLDNPSESEAAKFAVGTIDELKLALSKISSYMHRLAPAKSQQGGKL